MLPELLSQVPADVEIGTVSSDGGCDMHKCHHAIVYRGTHAFGPEAVMSSRPPRKKARLWKPSTGGAIVRTEAIRVSEDLGRAIRRKWNGYHRRSRAETKMHGVKLRGRSLMARDLDQPSPDVRFALPC
ncbi:hypothetical protein JMM60_01825 [Rhodovulum sulfidophilum]|uniref:Transposase n=1 Tax=Rhodovulum sulfidophilum TaxID=35806 RepID=A0ABS1RNR9_RHOSU|nr:hypothetical protein [Rhodovulum sulfidophilum]